jgi:hypothetical protein
MRGNPLPDTQNEIGAGVTELHSLHRTTKKPKHTYFQPEASGKP